MLAKLETLLLSMLLEDEFNNPLARLIRRSEKQIIDRPSEIVHEKMVLRIFFIGRFAPRPVAPELIHPRKLCRVGSGGISKQDVHVHVHDHEVDEDLNRSHFASR